MKKILLSLNYLIILVVLGACSVFIKLENEKYSITKIPKHFPLVNHPEGNEFTQARWDLGKKLFYDNILSLDSSISCASCHLPELAFSDNRAFSPGIKNRPGKRNAPSLANVAYHPYLLREGGVPTLEMQVLVPIQEENEFNHNIVDIGKLLEKDSSYVQMAMEAYSRAPDYYVITRSISLFERTLISGDSKYDKYVNKKEKLNTQEKKGMELFFSDKLKCSACHKGFNFTNYSFENNGLYSSYADDGRFRFSKDSNDIALFKVPTLRNIEVTAPYMHDGSLKTLKQVIEHYDSGGKSHVNKSSLILPLGLSQDEKDDLHTFLLTLTDNKFIQNPYLRPISLE
jgi:cytochrome c peroxidase